MLSSFSFQKSLMARPGVSGYLGGGREGRREGGREGGRVNSYLIFAGLLSITITMLLSFRFQKFLTARPGVSGDLEVGR